jgi:tetratricopeptide (TPR) repeat protein
VIPGERCPGSTGRDAFPHHCAPNLHNLFSADVKHLEVERPFVGVAVQRDRIGFVDREASGDATARVEVQTKMMELDGSGRVLRLELEPNSVVAHEYYARELVILARADEGLAQLKQVRDLHVNLSTDYPAWLSYLPRAYGNALELAQEIIAVDPNNAWGHYQAALVYERTGKQTEAVQHYLKCRKPHPRRSTENRALASRVRQGRC